VEKYCDWPLEYLALGPDTRSHASTRSLSSSTDGNFIPLNLDPPGREVSSYLFLSFFSVPPSRCVVVSGRDLALLCPLEIPNAVRGRQPRVSLVVAVRGPSAVEPWILFLTMTIAGHRHREQEYGYFSYYHHIVLGLEEVDSLVHTTPSQKSSAHVGSPTPFLFSSLALDVNSSGVRRLIQTFLRTCVPFPALDAEGTWHEEAHFAAPAELAMCLRWGLACILRVSGINAVRGLLSWDAYVEWVRPSLVSNFFCPVF
jgi:hypothetical protein